MTEQEQSVLRGAEEYGRILAEIPTSEPAERLRETLAFEMLVRNRKDAEIAQLREQLQREGGQAREIAGREHMLRVELAALREELERVREDRGIEIPRV